MTHKPRQHDIGDEGKENGWKWQPQVTSYGANYDVDIVD